MNFRGHKLSDHNNNVHFMPSAPTPPSKHIVWKYTLVEAVGFSSFLNAHIRNLNGKPGYLNRVLESPSKNAMRLL